MDDLLIEQKLYEYLQVVNSYLVKMGASKEDAEDIVQDTAYKFILYIDSIDYKNVKSWLFRVAINEYYDLYRKRKRRRTIMLNFDFQQLVEEYTPEIAVIQKEVEQDIDRILRKLRPKHREFLLLKYSTGLSTKEIADLSQMKVNSVKTTMYRARQQFIEEYRRQAHEQSE